LWGPSGWPAGPRDAVRRPISADFTWTIFLSTTLASLRGFFFVSDARALLIEKLLETDEDLVDVLGVSKIGHGIGNGIVILQA
jgi:hypothetical protein